MSGSLRAPRSVHTPRYREMLLRLRAARLKANLTQVQVAELLGRTQAWVSKCELGERRLDPIELADFAGAYSRPLKSFIPTKR